MIVTATASGGFTGLGEHFRIDTDSGPDGRALAETLAAAGLLGQAPGTDLSPDSVGADLRRWCISIDDGSGGAVRSVSLVEDGTPQNARWAGLLLQIRAAARP